MNRFKAVLHHDLFEVTGESQFFIEYDNVGVDFQWNSRMPQHPRNESTCQLIIELSSDENDPSYLSDEFDRIFLLIFLMMGSCPKIELISHNGIKRKLDDLPKKYFTHVYYQKLRFCICQPCSKNITKDVLSAFKFITDSDKVSILSFFSLQALVADAYWDIYNEHRLTLLIHAIEGLVNKPHFCKSKVKREIERFYPEENVQKRELFLKIYGLCSKTVFFYDDKYNCNILKVLKKDRLSFASSLEDTRDFYSHMLTHGKKPDRLLDANEFLIYFKLLIYSARLYLLTIFGVEVDEDDIQNTYKLLHDWIVEINQIENEPYFHGKYQMIKIWKEKGYANGATEISES